MFFEAQPFAAQERPHCLVRTDHASADQLILESMQDQVLRLLDPPTDEGPMGFQHRFAVTADLPGSTDPSPVALRRLPQDGRRKPKPRSHRPAAFAATNC